MGLGPVDRGEPAETVRSTPYPRSPPAPAAKCSTLPVLSPQSTIMDTNSLSQSLDSVNTAISVVGEEEVSVLSWHGLPPPPHGVGRSCLTGPFNKGHEQPGPLLIILFFILLILSDTDLPDNVWAAGWRVSENPEPPSHQGS